MRTRLTVTVLALTGFFGTAAAVAPAAHAESSPSAYASRLVQLINSARTSHGLSPLTVAAGTTTVATNWTEHLASVQSLSHNPDLGPQLESHGSPNWTTYGENVGEAPSSSASTLFNAYMNSPEHRANILGSGYRYIGVGVVFRGSTAWNTLDFVDQYSGSTTRTTTTTTTTRTVQHTATSTTTTHRTTARPVSRPVTHKATHTVARKPVRHTVAHAPRPVASATVEALSSTLPVAAPPAQDLSAAVTAPVHVPGHGRSPVPFAIAVWLLVLAASRFVLLRRQRAA